MSLNNKTLVITGAAGGLGREVVRVAREQGANVVQVDIAFPDNAEGETLSIDLTNAEAVTAAIAGIERIDGLINVAGGFDMGPTLYETTDEGWNKMFAINVTTARNMISAVVPKMLSQGGRAAVVNVGAFGALTGTGNMAAYCASKSVVMNMTQSLSDEVKHQGINVNAVLPSIIDTPANRAAMPDASYDEWVSPEQLANVMCFLVSDAASGVHGALIPVRGLS